MGEMPPSALCRHYRRRPRAGVLVAAGGALVAALIALPAAGSAAASTSRPSGAAAARVVPNVTAPGAPTHLVPTAGDAQVKLTWSGPANTGGAPVQYYVVRYSTNGGSSWTTGPTVYDTVTIVKNLHNGTAYIFEVRANNGTASGPYSDATDPVTPHGGGGSKDAVSIAAPKSAAVDFGKSATLSTTLTDTTTSAPVASATVTLLAKAAGAATFVEVGTDQTTDSQGTAQVTVKPKVTTDYRWSYDGDGKHNAATSSVGTIEVDQVINAHLTAAKVHHGKDVEVYGTVLPSVDEKVTLQRRHGGSWHTVGHGKIKVRTLPDGTHRAGFVIAVSTHAKGKQALRVRTKDNDDTGGGVSKKLKLTVT